MKDTPTGRSVDSEGMGQRGLTNDDGVETEQFSESISLLLGGTKVHTKYCTAISYNRLTNRLTMVPYSTEYIIPGMLKEAVAGYVFAVTASPFYLGEQRTASQQHFEDRCFRA